MESRTLTGVDLLAYENEVDRVILAIEPYVSALKIETVVLSRTAFRMGFDECRIPDDHKDAYERGVDG